MTPGFAAMLAVMAAAALTCRVAGFLAMRWLPASPRLDAALRATPLSVMAGITALALQAGGPAEALALAAAVALAFALGSDVAAALGGVALVAALRWAGL